MIGLILAILALISGVANLLPPLARLLQYSTNDIWPNLIPDIADLLAMGAKGIIAPEEAMRVMRYLGLSPAWTSLLQRNAERYLGVADYVSLYRRGKIDQGQLTRYLRLAQIPEAEIERVLQATEYFPGAEDLVRFAVREVYSPAVIQQFGTMEDIPTAYITEAAKAGLSEEQARNYWAAHWALPSPNQGFEMFQRGIIDRSTLELLLKTLDVMPYWREQLIKLSYNIMTRVDVRRMYGLGILTEDQVRASYRAQGYSPEDADHMTEFTVKYESKDMDGLTRANVVSAYKEGVISREELTEYLKGFGYVEDVINFWTDLADYQKTEETVKLYADDLVQQYLAGGRSIESVRADLDAFDLPSTYVDQVVRKTLMARAKKLKVPSREELTTWLKNSRITEEEYVANMRLLGYREQDIERYLTDIAEATDTTARKFLSVETYGRWYKKKIIDEKRYREILTAAAYSEADIDRLLAEMGG